MENIRLLLVDDEYGFRQTVSKRLKKRGFFPEEAGSGEEALSILAKKPIDVVVLDVKMTGIDGLETLCRIKETYSNSIEVILLTGHSSTQDGVSGIKSGAFDYLSKPVEFEHLLGKIKHAYEKIKRDEEKRREADFKARVEQQMIVTERLASLGTLAAGVAHEINNPLAIIKESAGWLRMLLKKEEIADMPKKERFDMALEKIEKSVDRAGKITHQLLGFARKTEPVIKEVNLNDIVDDVIQLVEREAKNRETEVIKKCNTEHNIIFSDPYQLRQVIVNLVTNALQATASGGIVTIIIEGEEDETILTVKDTGQGIPKENLERIFEPFFTTKPPGEGTGLGLSVSRGIIEKLGGEIAVESQIGKGSVFRIKLPGFNKIKDDKDNTENKAWLEKFRNLYRRKE
ncbi:MAG: ATP-binding protein [Thermodesulfobacteriota bacterium]|nr:ATP-binding protein [Thermodesulfobacteriota bacterium]